MNLVLRPLFVLLTLAMLVVAFFQVSGRIMFSVLDELEVGINQWLSPQRIVLNGLSGDWHWINPVLSIDRIELPAGELHGISVELDWLESLIRNRLVARRMTLGSGRLLLEQTAQGWRLAGAQEGGQFDPFDTLYHSDQIDVSVDLGFIDPAGVAQSSDDLSFHYLATNRGGQHRHRLSVGNTQQCTGDCRLQLSLDEHEAIAFVRPRALTVRLDGAGLNIPEPLLAGEGGRILELTGYWWLDSTRSAGAASISFADLKLDDDLLGGGFELASRGNGSKHHLQLTGLHMSNGETRWQLPEFWLTLENGSNESVLRAWTERIDTGSGFQFLTALAPPNSAVFRWLNALQVQATALNVHAFVKFPGFDTGYRATMRDISMDGYNGAPWIRGAAGEFLGANQLLQLSINTDDLGVHFPDIFHQRWVMDRLNGRLQAFVSGQYFGLRGSNLRVEFDDSHASGGFALSRPANRYYDERLTLLVNVDQTTVSRAKQYIPYRLPAGLPEWLENGPRQGNLHDVAVAYHGQIHRRPFELARRVEFAARIDEGVVQYHPDWPVVNDLSGLIAVAGRDVRIQVDQGQSLASTDLSGSFIRLANNAAVADIDLRSESSIDEALVFIRSTPLAQWMEFVTPDWAGQGPVQMVGKLRVPLKLGGEHIGESTMSDELEVDLDIALQVADLDLPGYGVALGDLEGTIHYIYPHGISGSRVRGRIFDRPAVFGASSDSDTVIFHVDGQAPYEEVLTLLDVRDPGIIRGGLDFIADLHIELADGVSRLDVVSDMTGLALDLPGEFAKAPDELVPTELELRFLADYQSLRFQYGSAQGWLHVAEAPLRGAIGFSAPAPMMDDSSEALVLGGRIDGFSIEQVVPDGSEGPALAIPLLLDGLLVDAIDVNGISFNDATLYGTIGGGVGADLDIVINSPDLVGALKLQGDAPLVLDLALLRLPPGDAEAGDPLGVQIMSQLVDADVRLDQVFVGETDYGSWSFKLRPGENRLDLQDLQAELRGVSIVADRLSWDGETDQSWFQGRLEAGNLAEVLPMWGYAASVATETAAMDADLTWRGSPAAVDLKLLVGEASFAAANGRFLDVTGGADAMKIFSLVNFSTIAKRLNFDFSDVVGEGVSFDSLTATSEFQKGRMQFLEPMAVDGSGSNFRIGGTVDLVDGVLDNEMIVTLPVTKGLPWYAAYVALANPLVGLGVLVGERVLRKPLEQFSSAKYEISGTLDDPELKFVSVWDTRMDQPQARLEATEVETVDEEPPAAPDAAGPERDTESQQDETTAQNTGSTTG